MERKIHVVETVTVTLDCGHQRQVPFSVVDNDTAVNCTECDSDINLKVSTSVFESLMKALSTALSEACSGESAEFEEARKVILTQHPHYAQAYAEGLNAPRGTENPYEYGTPQFRAWFEGSYDWLHKKGGRESR